MRPWQQTTVRLLLPFAAASIISDRGVAQSPTSQCQIVGSTIAASSGTSTSKQSSTPIAYLSPAPEIAVQQSPGETSPESENEPKHISDNSFLIEEAYNQEPGVVQHIFNWIWQWDRTHGPQREFGLLYVVELPIGSQRHQFSFTPIAFAEFYEHPTGGDPDEQGGFGDMFFNYRYQIWMEDEDGWRPAVAPRISVIAPTGDESRGLGTGEFGYQFNLPISKMIEPFAFHMNAGFTIVPDVSGPISGGVQLPGESLLGSHVGGSVIWLANYRTNLLLECIALWNEELDDSGVSDHTTEIILNPGVRHAIYTSDEVQWVLGLGVPIGLSPGAPDIGIFGYMSVEHAFRKQDNGCNKH